MAEGLTQRIGIAGSLPLPDRDQGGPSPVPEQSPDDRSWRAGRDEITLDQLLGRENPGGGRRRRYRRGRRGALLAIAAGGVGLVVVLAGVGLGHDFDRGGRGGTRGTQEDGSGQPPAAAAPGPDGGTALGPSGIPGAAGPPGAAGAPGAVGTAPLDLPVLAPAARVPSPRPGGRPAPPVHPHGSGVGRGSAGGRELAGGRGSAGSRDSAGGLGSAGGADTAGLVDQATDVPAPDQGGSGGLGGVLDAAGDVVTGTGRTVRALLAPGQSGDHDGDHDGDSDRDGGPVLPVPGL
jgi:hypothetical protein